MTPLRKPLRAILLTIPALVALALIIKTRKQHGQP